SCGTCGPGSIVLEAGVFNDRPPLRLGIACRWHSRRPLQCGDSAPPVGQLSTNLPQPSGVVKGLGMSLVGATRPSGDVRFCAACGGRAGISEGPSEDQF